MRKAIFILLGALGIFLLLAGCAGKTPEPGNVPDGTETPELIEAELQLGFWLPIGREAFIKGEDLRVAFEDVIEDSRCPLNVECIWEGRASYTVRFTHGELSTRMVLTEPGLGGRAIDRFLDYEITAMLDPYPEAPDQISKEDYRLRMSIQKLPPSPFGEEDRADIYATVIRQLYEVDHSFGSSRPDFPNLYLVYMTDDSVGGEFGAPPASSILPETLRTKIADKLSDLPAEIFWVNSFNAVPLEENSLVKGGGAVIRVGNINEGEGGKVEVAGSIYVANLAAAGRTYVLEKQGSKWQITGTTGPMWIS
jgi:hypothetical protein